MSLPRFAVVIEEAEAEAIDMVQSFEFPLDSRIAIRAPFAKAIIVAHDFRYEVEMRDVRLKCGLWMATMDLVHALGPSTNHLPSSP